ncbi:MAG: zinc metalloprotease HtpX [Planctomycetes bacterium]|nr:zinc metalloprotease HtpX [Planctomycetota bacterium]NOG53260.1 M48 family metallopeptidase [Planctomycetota bacterium]
MRKASPSSGPTSRAYPANVTFNTLIRSNKRKSVVLMIGMGVFVVVVVTVMLMAGLVLLGSRGGGEVDPVQSLVVGATAAVVVAVLAALWSFYGGGNAILKMSGAVQIPREVDPQLHNVVEELAIAAGIPMPAIYIIDDTALNAFATGRDPDHAAVAITKGLRYQLSRDELAGVMAHELSHVRHFDIRFAMLMATMVGLVVFACDAFFQVARYQFWFGRGMSGRGSRSRDGGGQAQAILAIGLLVLALVLAAVAPMVVMLIRFAVSREREYLADAGAVELTRNPLGLISALEKLGACREPLEVANRATAHLYMVNPLKHVQKGKGHELNSAFSTHPPLTERIARLRALIE